MLGVYNVAVRSFYFVDIFWTLTTVIQELVVETMEGFSHFLWYGAILIFRIVLEVSQQENLHVYAHKQWLVSLKAFKIMQYVGLK